MRWTAPGSPDGICVGASTAIRGVLLPRPSMQEQWERTPKPLREWQGARGLHHALPASKCRSRSLAARSWQELPEHRGLGATEQSTAPFYTEPGCRAPCGWEPAVQTAPRPVALDLDGGSRPARVTTPAGPVPPEPAAQFGNVRDMERSRIGAVLQTGAWGNGTVPQPSQNSAGARGEADTIHAGDQKCNEQTQVDAGGGDGSFGVVQQLAVPQSRSLTADGGEGDQTALPEELQSGGLFLNNNPGLSGGGDGGGDVHPQELPSSLGFTGEKSGGVEEGEAYTAVCSERQVSTGQTKVGREVVVDQPLDTDEWENSAREGMLSRDANPGPPAPQPPGRTEATLAVEFLEGQVIVL